MNIYIYYYYDIIYCTKNIKEGPIVEKLMYNGHVETEPGGFTTEISDLAQRVFLLPIPAEQCLFLLM